MLPPPFNTPEELRALAYRLSARARWAAELGRAQRLRGDPVAWRALINRWYPSSGARATRLPAGTTRTRTSPQGVTIMADNEKLTEAEQERVAQAPDAQPGLEQAPA